jgi:hypothetical protein
MRKKEVLLCEETRQPIEKEKLAVGQWAGGGRMFTFQVEALNRVPRYEREATLRKKRDGGINFFQATSDVDERTGQCLGNGLKVGDFLFALPPNAVNAYLRTHSRRNRKF